MLAAAAPAVLAAGIWVQQYRRSERGAAAGEGPYAELEEEELEAPPEVQHTAGPAKVRPNASSAASAQPRRPAAAARSSTPQLAVRARVRPRRAARGFSRSTLGGVGAISGSASRLLQATPS